MNMPLLTELGSNKVTRFYKYAAPIGATDKPTSDICFGG